MNQKRVPMTPIDSNQSTFKSQTSKTQEMNYQFPFQVQKQKLSTVPDQSQENNNLYMSPRNIKLKTQTVKSPNCRSPLTTRKEIKQISSPFNFSIHSAQSPQKVESYSFIKSECDTIKQKNGQLQKEILSLESEIQRVQSNTLMKELQQKIELLTKMNEKLNIENKDLSIKGNVSKLKKDIEQQEKTIKQFEKQLKELEQNKIQYDVSKFEQDKNTATDYITQLILDLEERVHNLIIENANLNKEFNQRIKLSERFNTLELELKQAQVQFQRSKLEEKLLRVKINQLKKK